MRPKTFFAALALLGLQGGLRSESVPYRWIKTVLEISAEIPPALVWISDSQGRSSGVTSSAASVQEIPHSSVQQSGSPIPPGPGQPRPSAHWMIAVMDPDAQVFTLHLKGLEKGLGHVELSSIYHSGSAQGGSLEIPFYSVAGLERQIQIDYDPLKRTFESQWRLKSGDMAADLSRACDAGDLGPQSACRALEGLAKASEALFSGGAKKRLALHTWIRTLDRLHHFGEEGNKDWNDFKDDPRFESLIKAKPGEAFFAKDTAYAILLQEAKAKLADLGEKNGRVKTAAELEEEEEAREKEEKKEREGGKAIK